MSNLCFIPSHHVEAADNYNKEKLITTKIVTSTTGINETAKMPLLKLFLYFSIRDNVTMITLYIYIYRERERERERERTKNLNCRITQF